MVDIKFLLVASLLVVTCRHVTAQTNTAQQCGSQVQTVLSQCNQQSGIQVANFLWFVSNGTSPNGQKPADEAGFKTQLCGKEIEIGQCVLTRLAPLFNSSVCQGSPQLAQTVDSFFFTYDAKCAHPCRQTLVPDMTACYTQAGLSTDLFLSNQTRGQVIGATEAEVNTFCAAKDTLLSCLKPKVDACPESLQILSTQQFHMPSYEQVVNILCRHPHVYVTGLSCFDEPTPAVEACVQKNTQAFIQAAINAQQQNWTADQYVRETCRVNIDQIKCDLEAWAAKKHASCASAVVGLRREMECKLLPVNCSATQPSKFQAECNEAKYNGALRDDFGKAGGAGGGDGGSDFVRVSIFAFIMSLAIVFSV